MDDSKRPENIPLDLHTHWFITETPKFPYPSLRQLGTIMNADYRWETVDSPRLDGSKDHTFIGAAQWEEDCSITKIRIRWNSANINETVVGEVKNITTPSSKNNNNNSTVSARDGSRPSSELSRDELRLASDWYGPHITRWCHNQLGRTIGDGECWTLAYKALAAAGKPAIREGREPPMLSVGRVHGQLIFEWSVDTNFPITGAMLDHVADVSVRAGDMLEITRGHFRKARVVLEILGQEENVRFDVHTAVIVRVEGQKLGVIEQNARVKKTVVEGEYDLGNMVCGNVKIYRPIGGRSTVIYPSLQGVCDEW